VECQARMRRTCKASRIRAEPLFLQDRSRPFGWTTSSRNGPYPDRTGRMRPPLPRSCPARTSCIRRRSPRHRHRAFLRRNAKLELGHDRHDKNDRAYRGPIVEGRQACASPNSATPTITMVVSTTRFPSMLFWIKIRPAFVRQQFLAGKHRLHQLHQDPEVEEDKTIGDDQSMSGSGCRLHVESFVVGFGASDGRDCPR